MILLDTHAWLFWVDDTLGQLSTTAHKRIVKAESMGVSIMSVWEIAMLVAKQRLSLSLDIMEWVERALNYPGIRLLDLDPKIVVTSTRLPGDFHGDPADRLIVSTCLKYGVPLVTKDKKIHKWGKIKVIW